MAAGSLGDVTGACRTLRVHLSALRQGRGKYASPRSSGRVRYPGDPGTPDVPGIGEVCQERQPGGGNVVAPQVGCLVGVRRTAQVLQQRRVHGVPDVWLGSPGSAPEPGGDDGTLQ